MLGSSIFFGGSVVAALLAGMISLFAPCCVSVMLPAYFAASFHNKRLRIAMTFLFAAGIATVILPLVLGASAIRRILINDHTTVYLIGGILLLALGIFTLLGGKLRLPSPAGRPTATGPFGVYSLGLFSGVASSCCAPVLAGVIALSGVTASTLRAAGLGFAYVFGMVAPLMLMSALWDRYDWKTARLFRPRSITWRIGSWRRTLSGTSLVSGLMLITMGGWALMAARTGGMRAVTGGWQATLLLDLQDAGHRITRALSWLPNWAAWLTFVVMVALLGRAAVHQIRHAASPPANDPDNEPGGQATNTDTDQTAASTVDLLEEAHP